MGMTAGLDVGGAHLKVALVEAARTVAVRQIACPLWQGLDKLDTALAEAHALQFFIEVFTGTRKYHDYGFVIFFIATRSGQDAVLAKARSTEPRRFGNPASAMILLREVGIAVAQLDATDWNPDEKDMSRSRSSQAEAMRTAHQAAAHNRWLAAEIQESLDDPRPSVPHDEAMAAMDAEIDAIELQRAGSARRKGT